VFWFCVCASALMLVPGTVDPLPGGRACQYRLVVYRVTIFIRAQGKSHLCPNRQWLCQLRQTSSTARRACRSCYPAHRRWRPRWFGGRLQGIVSGWRSISLAAGDRCQARDGSERQDVPPTPLSAFFMFSVILVVGWWLDYVVSMLLLVVEGSCTR
jgi:hypothetical protein